MKQLPAIIAAFIITAFTALGMFAIGGNALLNTNTVPIQGTTAVQAAPSDPTAAATTAAPASADAAAQAQIKQLQDLVAQYQSRDKQYQTLLSDAAQKLKDTSSQSQQTQAQVQQLQNVLVQLQQRGVISVASDGSITIPSRRGSSSGQLGETQ